MLLMMGSTSVQSQYWKVLLILIPLLTDITVDLTHYCIGRANAAYQADTMFNKLL